MEYSPPPRLGNWASACAELLSGARHPTCYNDHLLYYRKLIANHKSKKNMSLITLNDLPSIKKAQEEAIRDNKETFHVTLSDGEDAELLVDYAKYVIEYLEAKTANDEMFRNISNNS
jgi:hypothetical protein